MVGDKKMPIKRNHIKYYFIVRQGKLTLRSSGKAEIKKGYGVICNHPGGITRTYIAWYDDGNGNFIYNETIRGASKFHTEELGISIT